MAAAPDNAQMKEVLQRLSPNATGKQIYDVACAGCHGIDGDGNGPGAQGFVQPATKFTKGTYAFRSTTSEYPAEGDLERSIREGMAGTEMVPFKRILSEAGIRAVAGYIKSFSPKFDEPHAVKSVKIPPRPFPVSAQSIAAGKQVFEENCVDCHGSMGQGTKDEQDDWGRPVHMIDFRLGYYKSGHHDTDLYRSIDTGMLGTSMPSFSEDLSSAQIWHVVDYIRSLAQKPTSFFGRLWDALFVTRPSGFDYRNY